MAAGGSSTDHRRGKSGLFLVACGGAGLAPHWLPEPLRLIPALILAVVLGGYSLRTLLLQAFRPYLPPPGLGLASRPDAGPDAGGGCGGGGPR